MANVCHFIPLACLLLACSHVSPSSPVQPSAAADAGHVPEVSVDGRRLLVDGKPTTLLGFRVGSAPLREEWTQQLIAQLDVWRRHGVNSLIVWLQGTSGGFTRTFARDGAIDEGAAPILVRSGYGLNEVKVPLGEVSGRDVVARTLRIVDAAAAQQMVVLVGLIYRHAVLPSDTVQSMQAAMRAGAAPFAGRRNVIIDLWNEAHAGRPLQAPAQMQAYARAVREVAPDRPICVGGNDQPSNLDYAALSEIDLLCHDSGRTLALAVESMEALKRFGKPVINVESFGGAGGGYVDLPVTGPAPPDGYVLPFEALGGFRRVYGVFLEDDYPDATQRRLVGRRGYRSLIAHVARDPDRQLHLMVHIAGWFQGASRTESGAQVAVAPSSGRWSNVFGVGHPEADGSPTKPGILWVLREMAATRSLGAVPGSAAGHAPTMKARRWYFPPPGEALNVQARRRPEEVGLRPDVVATLRGRAPSWALWRHGYLVHVEGDFNDTQEVRSLRKTWHALTVGAAIQQGRIGSLHEEIRRPGVDLSGLHATATWWHVITQTSAFDYPYGAHPAYRPGQIWTYSDANPVALTNALARVYGREGYADDYEGVARAAYFDAIGMRGWQARPQRDGTRFRFDLEDMGRLGLLVLARGEWDGVQLVPSWFVEQLETKQTRGIPSNYNGPNDGRVALLENAAHFREAPYGFMTWTNADGDYYPGAHRRWSWGSGAGGHAVLWNYELGLVYACHGLPSVAPPVRDGVPHALEGALVGPNPLVDEPR